MQAGYALGYREDGELRCELPRMIRRCGRKNEYWTPMNAEKRCDLLDAPHCVKR